MWKYCDANKSNEFLLSLNLIKLDMSNDDIIKTLYTVSNNIDKHYTLKKIKKKNGEFRTLYIPDYLLNHIQKNILKSILNGFSVSRYATAYTKGKGIKDNALPHVNNKIILKMDIKNFFDDITFLMIYNKVFKEIYFPPQVRGLLTNLCCSDEHLPQGASTSPAISNLILKPFDEYIGEFCAERNIAYTRYCDDMTFSGDFEVSMIIKKVTSFLNEMGFTINTAKTKVLSRAVRQTVTGIVVNEKVQVSRDYRKDVRKKYYYCHKFGVKSQLKEGIEAKAYLLSLFGQVNYILSINQNDKYFKNAQLWLKKELKKY